MWFCGQKATFFISDSFIFAESFRPNPQVARNTFDFFHLCLKYSYFLTFELRIVFFFTILQKLIGIIIRMVFRQLWNWSEDHLEKERKKCRKAEYVQRRVRFINVQVPCPLSIIYVKFCTSRRCMKMSSFLFVRTWAMPRTLYLLCEFHFRFGHLITYPVWHQLSCGCQGEKSSKKCQVTF